MKPRHWYPIIFLVPVIILSTLVAGGFIGALAGFLCLVTTSGPPMLSR